MYTIENYATIETLPATMRKELADSPTADKAEAVFSAWSAKGVTVEYRERAAIWLDA